MTELVLPCRCKIEVDFTEGRKGICCPRHEQAFCAEATPRGHEVIYEIPYHGEEHAHG